MRLFDIVMKPSCRQFYINLGEKVNYPNIKLRTGFMKLTLKSVCGWAVLDIIEFGSKHWLVVGGADIGGGGG